MNRHRRPTFAQLIKRRCRKLGLTTNDLALMLGIPYAFELQQWEDGKSFPSLRSSGMQKVRKVLELTTEDVVIACERTIETWDEARRERLSWLQPDATPDREAEVNLHVLAIMSELREQFGLMPSAELVRIIAENPRLFHSAYAQDSRKAQQSFLRLRRAVIKSKYARLPVVDIDKFYTE